MDFGGVPWAPRVRVRPAVGAFANVALPQAVGRRARFRQPPGAIFGANEAPQSEAPEPCRLRARKLTEMKQNTDDATNVVVQTFQNEANCLNDANHGLVQTF